MEIKKRDSIEWQNISQNKDDQKSMTNKADPRYVGLNFKSFIVVVVVAAVVVFYHVENPDIYHKGPILQVLCLEKQAISLTRWASCWGKKMSTIFLSLLCRFQFCSKIFSPKAQLLQYASAKQQYLEVLALEWRDFVSSPNWLASFRSLRSLVCGFNKMRSSSITNSQLYRIITKRDF